MGLKVVLVSPLVFVSDGGSVRRAGGSSRVKSNCHSRSTFCIAVVAVTAICGHNL